MLLPALLVVAPSQDAIWLERFQQGEAALAAGELVEARAAFGEALEAAPEHAGTAVELAVVEAGAGDGEEARRWLERAVAWGWRDGALLLAEPELAGVDGLEALAREAEGREVPEPVEAQILHVRGRVGLEGNVGGPIVWLGEELVGYQDLDSGRIRAVVPEDHTVVLDRRLGGWLHYGAREGEAVVVELPGGETLARLEEAAGLELLHSAVNDGWVGVVGPLEHRYVKVWNADGSLRAPFLFRAGRLVVSPDGRRAWATDRWPGWWYLLDLENGVEIAQPLEGRWHCGFLDDRTAYLQVRGKRLAIVDADSGVVRTVLPEGSEEPFPDFVVDPERRAFLTVFGETMRAIAPDGSVVEEVPVAALDTGDLDLLEGTVLPWDPERVHDWEIPRPHERDPVGALAACPDEESVLRILESGRCGRFSLATGQPVGPSLEPVAGVYDLWVAPDGRRALGRTREEQVVWDLATGELLARLSPDVATTPDLETTLVLEEGELVARELASGEERFRFLPSSRSCVALAPEARGSLALVLDSGSRAWLLDTADGTTALGPVETPLSTTPEVLVLDGANRRVLAASGPEDTWILDLETGARRVPKRPSFGQEVFSAAFGPEGSELVLLTSDWTDLYWIDPATGECDWHVDSPLGGMVGFPRIEGAYVALGGKLFALGDREEIVLPGTTRLGACGPYLFGVDAGLVVADRRTGSRRYERVAHAGGAELVVLPNHWLRGDTAALDAAALVVDGEPCPLIERGTELYSPRRVAAALRGVPVADPVLETGDD